jgi:hypothetical protein
MQPLYPSRLCFGEHWFSPWPYPLPNTWSVSLGTSPALLGSFTLVSLMFPCRLLLVTSCFQKNAWVREGVMWRLKGTGRWLPRLGDIWPCRNTAFTFPTVVMLAAELASASAVSLELVAALVPGWSVRTVTVHLCRWGSSLLSPHWPQLSLPAPAICLVLAPWFRCPQSCQNWVFHKPVSPALPLSHVSLSSAASVLSCFRVPGF